MKVVTRKSIVYCLQLILYQHSNCNLQHSKLNHKEHVDFNTSVQEPLFFVNHGLPYVCVINSGVCVTCSPGTGTTPDQSGRRKMKATRKINRR